MWANISAFLFLAFIGIGYDSFGRKVIFILGYIIAGICFICLPLSNQVYPDFLIMRIFLELSMRISGTSGGILIADYIDEKS